MSILDIRLWAEQERYLHPGEIACGRGDMRLGTLLGSCVAVTIWHRTTQFGCMCHFILPEAPPKTAANTRYADVAFDSLCRITSDQGIALKACEIKLFGGGRMFPWGDDLADIGQRNIDAAHRLIARAGLSTMAENVGGEGYRRVHFDLATGDVWIKFDAITEDVPDICM